MRSIVQAKFAQNHDLADKLLSTGDAVLEEGNNWGDRIWGVVWEDGRKVGENRLGRILMDTRSRLRQRGNAELIVLERSNDGMAAMCRMKTATGARFSIQTPNCCSCPSVRTPIKGTP